MPAQTLILQVYTARIITRMGLAQLKHKITVAFTAICLARLL